MPTALERSGNFSQSHDATGNPIQIKDPVTGLPFAGNTIPRERISPQAASLLGYYPQATRESDGRYNYEMPILSVLRQESLQSRLTQNVNQRNQIFGNVSYQRTTTDANTLFGFEDQNRASAIDTQVNWTHRIAQLTSIRLRYQFTRQTTETRPSSHTGRTSRARRASTATTRNRSTGARRVSVSQAASRDSRTACRDSRATKAMEAAATSSSTADGTT